MITASNYNYKDWEETFSGEIELYSLAKKTQWKEFFGRASETGMFTNIERILTEERDSNKSIFPYPDLMFNPFEHLSIDDIKVVFIGQDPYFNAKYINDKMVPEAMGVSFSVPIGIPIPPSLQNIYKNLLKYQNIMKMPSHGNLQSWVTQGCMLMNTAMTVRKGEPNSHVCYWKLITDKIIKYISNNTEGVSFVFWGANAYSKLDLIDLDKHTAVISSHPSSRSCTTPLKTYPAFDNQDHFSIINGYLKECGKTPIVWQV